MAKPIEKLVRRLTDTTRKPWLRGVIVALGVVVLGFVFYVTARGVSRQVWAWLRKPKDMATVARIRATKMKEWKYIVLHHSATPKGNVASFDTYHRQERKWPNGLGYHFVIGNGTFSGDGEVEVGDRWKDQREGAHCADLNSTAIGICLVGNFEDSAPTPKQIESLVGLIRHLQAVCHVPAQNILLHRQAPGGSTLCPGRNFPFEQVKRLLAAPAQPEPAT